MMKGFTGGQHLVLFSSLDNVRLHSSSMVVTSISSYLCVSPPNSKP
ncbi:hypothetical protein [Rubritalea tangerina]